MSSTKFDNELWRCALIACRNILGVGSWDSSLSKSWCAFTTFSSLSHRTVYWNCGFPDEHELLTDRTSDGGLWRQSFHYSDLAHIVIPKNFYWERVQDSLFESGLKSQNLEALCEEFLSKGVPFNKSELVAEIKLY